MSYKPSPTSPGYDTTGGTGDAGVLVARYRRGSASSIVTTGGGGVVLYDNNDYDILSGHSPTVNPGRYTFPFAGYWGVSGTTYHGPIASGTGITTFIRLNGSGVYNQQWWGTANNSGSAGNSISFSDLVTVLSGDYVDILVGNTLNSSTAPIGSFVLIKYLGAGL